MVAVLICQEGMQGFLIIFLFKSQFLDRLILPLIAILLAEILCIFFSVSSCSNFSTSVLLNNGNVSSLNPNYIRRCVCVMKD